MSKIDTATEAQTNAAIADKDVRGKHDNTLEIERDKADEPRERALARTALRPTVRAASAIRDLNRTLLGEMHLMSLVDELQAQSNTAISGDLGRAEAMLMVHAHTLDALFNELIRRATLNMNEYINAAETYLKLGLKAQSQCRTTLETLAQIKNPSSVAFVKQANISTGPQQVNNGTAPTRAENFENQPSKLLERTNGERLDFGAPAAATGVNTPLEALGTINGAYDLERQINIGPEREQGAHAVHSSPPSAAAACKLSRNP